MDEELRRLTEELHAGDSMAAIALAGAGAQSVAWLLGVPGASRTVLELLVLYASASLVEFLGHEPAQSASAETAREMAKVAYSRAVRLRPGQDHVAGIGCAAAIASDRPKRGDHRCHVCAWDAHGATTYSLTLAKGARDRLAEDRVASLLVMRALAEVCDVNFDLTLDLTNDEAVEVSRTSYGDPIAALVSGHISNAVFQPDWPPIADGRLTGAILAGSFDPLHDGHRQLAAVASRILDAEVTFELSVTNVDKPPLAEAEVRRRAGQFSPTERLTLTQAPVFFEKARLFPGCTFVIGWDTMTRLVDLRYYGGSRTRMLIALDETRGLGCSFLVAGRWDGADFRGLEDVSIPEDFEEMFRSIPQEEFRSDVSSTEIRMAARSQGRG